jgi:hypothetical protein
MLKVSGKIGQLLFTGWTDINQLFLFNSNHYVNQLDKINNKISRLSYAIMSLYPHFLSLAKSM